MELHQTKTSVCEVFICWGCGEDCGGTCDYAMEDGSGGDGYYEYCGSCDEGTITVYEWCNDCPDDEIEADCPLCPDSGTNKGTVECTNGCTSGKFYTYCTHEKATSHYYCAHNSEGKQHD